MLACGLAFHIGQDCRLIVTVLALVGISFMEPSSHWSIFRTQAKPLRPQAHRQITSWLSHAPPEIR
jgi:hypothetical protein